MGRGCSTHGRQVHSSSVFPTIHMTGDFLYGPNPSRRENKPDSVVIAVDCTETGVAVLWLNTSQSVISQNTQIDSSTHTKGPMNRTQDHNIAMTTSQMDTRTENYVIFQASFNCLFFAYGLCNVMAVINYISN
jgi:hypothetical protein